MALPQSSLPHMLNRKGYSYVAGLQANLHELWTCRIRSKKEVQACVYHLAQAQRCAVTNNIYLSLHMRDEYRVSCAVICACPTTSPNYAPNVAACMQRSCRVKQHLGQHLWRDACHPKGDLACMSCLQKSALIAGCNLRNALRKERVHQLSALPLASSASPVLVIPSPMRTVTAMTPLLSRKLNLGRPVTF